MATKFQELLQIIASVHGETLATLIDVLLPEHCEGCSVLREAALLALPQCEDPADLFDLLKTAVTQPELPEEGNYVRIMSLHKSKGLTSKVAIIAGCIRGLIPFQNLQEPLVEQAQILLEQRRLFYVAITRCTEILVISSAIRLQRDFAFKIGAQIQGFGNPVMAVTSQFIPELGPQAPQSRLGAHWQAAGYA